MIFDDIHPQPSALTLFGSLKSKVPFSRIRKETETAERAMAEEAVQEGLDPRGIDLQYSITIRVKR